MAVNGIRVSALPEMIASDLTNDDYLIVNDANTNTRRINYEEFLKSVNTDISDLDVVQSVNGFSGVVSLDAADVGAPSLVQFQALETTSNAAGALAAANASAIVTLNTDTSTNTSDIAQLRIDVDLKAPNIPSLNSTNFLVSGSTVGVLFDQIDQAVITRAPNVADKNSTNFITNEMTVGQSVDALDTQIATTANSLGSEYTKTVDADLRYALKGTGTNSVDDNAAAIAGIVDGTTDQESPKINGVKVTATGAELNQLDGVTLGTAAESASTDFATPAAVAAVQADVDQNETDGDAADAALSGRLDTLEADPTTATALAAVRADVDANEVTAADASAAAQDTANKIQTKLAGLTVAAYSANDVSELQGIITILIGELKAALS